MNYHQASYDEPLLFEIGSSDDDFDVSLLRDIPKQIRREALPLPDIPEREVFKHFVRLSQMNFSVDSGFYPLGSCTMKYNPKLAEQVARYSKVTDLHPEQDPSTVQGALQIMNELEGYLAEIGGVDAVTLQPAAGAQGEFTGLQIVRAYHSDRGGDRNEVIVPDTAHGTNPASAAMAGYDLIEIPSKSGHVDCDALEAIVGNDTAALMLTNPNTLGIFERDVIGIADIVHRAGALLYYDGANLNAIMGRSTPGSMNFDIVHFNLHKTFATPHGGGGPGAGPVGVKQFLEPYLPVPRIVRKGDRFDLDYERPKSIGTVRAYVGNFAVLVRAYCYIRMMGAEGLRDASLHAVANANYLRAKLEKLFELPFGGRRMHEFVLSGRSLKERGLRTFDFAKRLLDHGFHSPTVYFPHIVDEAMMIEPTETESSDTLDRFVAAFEAILHEDPEIVQTAPHNTSVGRVDEVKAARNLIFNFGSLKALEK
ncbi:MAG TPA: glycine dehydrogenase subunit 2 [Euryarchaeota archaeon]|nr:glycine dehydrogenase subunit 2 [Euryarchaeota archaeon]